MTKKSKKRPAPITGTPDEAIKESKARIKRILARKVFKRNPVQVELEDGYLKAVLSDSRAEINHLGFYCVYADTEYNESPVDFVYADGRWYIQEDLVTPGGVGDPELYSVLWLDAETQELFGNFVPVEDTAIIVLANEGLVAGLAAQLEEKSK